MTVPEKDALKLEIYSDEDIVDFTHQVNAEAWRGLLSPEEYVERERVLASTPLSNKHKDSTVREKFPTGYEWVGLKYFVLKDTRLPNTSKTSQIVSSCETLNTPGYCMYPEGDPREIEEGSGIQYCLNVCIGGVFTAKKYRGQGYAGAMIDLLNKFYENLRDTAESSSLLKNLVMTLYSEVKDYYERVGYILIYVPLHYIRESQFDNFVQQYCDKGAESRGEYLEFDDYKELVQLQDEQVKQDLLDRHRTEPQAYIFTVRPDFDKYQWFQHRDVFIMEKLGRGTTGHISFGYVLGDKSHIIWHHHWSENTLIILKVYIPKEIKDQSIREEKLGSLLFQAIKEAQRTKLEALEFWDEEIMPDRLPKLNSVLRDVCEETDLYATNGSLSAVKPPKGITADSIIWVNNTKASWF